MAVAVAKHMMRCLKGQAVDRQSAETCGGCCGWLQGVLIGERIRLAAARYAVAQPPDKHSLTAPSPPVVSPHHALLVAAVSLSEPPPAVRAVRVGLTRWLPTSRRQLQHENVVCVVGCGLCEPKAADI